MGFAFAVVALMLAVLGILGVVAGGVVVWVAIALLAAALIVGPAWPAWFHSPRSRP